MRKKIFGIFICLILIVTILPVKGTTSIKNEEVKDIFWISSLVSLDSNFKNKGLTTTQKVDWLYYGNGSHWGALGLAGGGTFEWAVKFTPSELENWSGYKISIVRYYHSNPGSPFYMDGTVKIYEEGNSTEPGDLLSIENFTAYEDGWTDIELSKPIYIGGDKDLWISIEGTHSSGEYPAGMDPGPVVDGKGDWTYIDGLGWFELKDFGYDNNFNIWAGVSPIIGTGSIPIIELEYQVTKVGPLFISGLFGINVLLNNIGEEIAKNIKWYLNIEGGAWFKAQKQSGSEDFLEPNSLRIIKIGTLKNPIFGLGRSNITFFCNYSIDLNTSRDEIDGGNKEEGVDQCLLFTHTFPPDQQPDTEWRTLFDHEYRYTNNSGIKAVDFRLDPPQPTQLHQIRVYDPHSLQTKYTAFCKLNSGIGEHIENWITIDDVTFLGAEWQIEIK